MFVGAAEPDPLRRRDPQVAQLALADGQFPADPPEPLGPAPVAEEHGNELAPAGKPPRVAFTVGHFHGPLEVHPREGLEKLAEQTGEPTRR